MKKVLIISIGAAFLFGAGTFMWLTRSSGPAEVQISKTLSPAIVQAVVKEIRLETVSMSFTQSFVESRFVDVPLFGEMLAEEGTFIISGTLRAGFPKAAIHVVSMTSVQIELTLDAPDVLSLEDTLKGVAYDRNLFIRPSIHFEENARENGKQQLRTAACAAKILTKANESAQEEIKAALAKFFKKVIVKTTVLKNC